MHALLLEWVPVVLGEGLGVYLKEKEGEKENQINSQRVPYRKGGHCLWTEDWCSLDCEAWKSVSHGLRSSLLSHMLTSWLGTVARPL